MTDLRTALTAQARRTARRRVRSRPWTTATRWRPVLTASWGWNLRPDARERGDVPGWVLVTLVTAGLVLALWALAGPALTGVFSDSIARVSGAIGG